MLPLVGASAAQAPVGLGTAGSFAVLAGSGITNTGPTTITGDVGTFPTPSMTGFGSVTLHGTDHAGDAVTQQAKTDLTTAYNTAVAATPTTAVPTELGGSTLTPGVYGGPTLGITGTLTLNTLGDPNAVFVFKAGSTLITAASSSVIVLNGATACNVFWQVGSSATLGTGSRLVGTVLASTSISAGTGATVQGRLLASNGAVTLDTNTITRPTCAPPATTTTTTTAPGATTTTPTPGTTPTTLASTGPGSPTAPGAPPSAPAAIPGTGVTGGPVGGPSGGSSSAGSPGTPTGGGTGRPGSPGTPTGGPSGPGSPGGGTPGLDLTGGTPGLALTGMGLGTALMGGASVVTGALLVAGSRLRRRSLRNAS
jgi:type VI secretion system secreted protein VgrG